MLRTRQRRLSIKAPFPNSQIAKAFIELSKFEELRNWWFDRDDIASAMCDIFLLPRGSAKVLTGKEISKLVESTGSGMKDLLNNNNDFGIYEKERTEMVWLRRHCVGNVWHIPAPKRFRESVDGFRIFKNRHVLSRGNLEAAYFGGHRQGRVVGFGLREGTTSYCGSFYLFIL